MSLSLTVRLCNTKMQNTTYHFATKINLLYTKCYLYKMRYIFVTIKTKTLTICD